MVEKWTAEILEEVRFEFFMNFEGNFSKNFLGLLN